MLDNCDYEDVRKYLIRAWDGDLLGLCETLKITVSDVLDNFEWEDNEYLAELTFGTTDWRLALQGLQDTAD